MIRDITERRRIEQQLFQEKMLAQVTLASIGDGVIYATDGTYDGTRRVADIERYGTVVPRARV